MVCFTFHNQSLPAHLSVLYCLTSFHKLTFNYTSLKFSPSVAMHTTLNHYHTTLNHYHTCHCKPSSIGVATHFSQINSHKLTNNSVSPFRLLTATSIDSGSAMLTMKVCDVTLTANKIVAVANGSFDPPTLGLWAQCASSAPIRSVGISENIVINTPNHNLSHKHPSHSRSVCLVSHNLLILAEATRQHGIL